MHPERTPGGPDVIKATRNAGWRALAGPALVLCVLGAAMRLGAPQWQGWQDRLAGLGGWAPAAYVGLWLVLAPCCFPAAVLGLVAGAVFGPWLGGALAIGGLVGSGLLMHGLGRRWLRPRLAGFVSGRPRLAELQRAAAGGPVRLHLLARLSPLNYAIVSYTLAAGGAPLRTYVPGLVGGMPGLVAYVWLGSVTGADPVGPGAGGHLRLVVLVIGAASLLVLGIVVGRALARSAAASAPETATRDADQGR